MIFSRLSNLKLFSFPNINFAELVNFHIMIFFRNIILEKTADEHCLKRTLFIKVVQFFCVFKNMINLYFKVDKE